MEPGSVHWRGCMRSILPPAFRFAYLLTGDAELAEDLVQDAFVRLIGRFGNIRRRESLDSYLKQTILNLSYGSFRRRRVERAYLARERALPRAGSRFSGRGENG